MAANPVLPPSRPWKDIARELSAETDLKRIGELAHELNRAIVEQEPKHPK
jgi:hypothetical protein